ncbi:unnamed protein product [Prunus armeniaca]|uniref:Uncharacterized protein n=1 Tax=Prunus armeniaca TaxID=36596 RepID=A0A6J5V610_PRUAR|nr:unnamed protein product [Prunus armeniaca]
MARSYRRGKSEPFVWWTNDLGFLRWWFSIGVEFSSTEEIGSMYGFDSTLNQTKSSPCLIGVLFVLRGDSIKKQRHSLWLSEDSGSIDTPNMSLDVLHATCVRMYTNSMWV